MARGANAESSRQFRRELRNTWPTLRNLMLSMNTETPADREAHAEQGARQEPPRRPLLTAVAWKSFARKIFRALALTPIIFASAAFAQVTLSPTANQKIAGVGMILQQQGADLVIGSVVPKSPADGSKLIHKGDRILAVAEGEEPSQPLNGKTMEEAVGLIRGSVGSKVRLTVVSEGADDREARDVLLTRERLNLDPGEPLDDDAVKPDAVAHDSATPGLDFERLPGGEADKLSNYRGKIVVLEFWATWCGPCEGAMADLQRSAAHMEKLRDKLVFITVSMDRAKEAPAARLKEKGWADALNGWADRKALAPWQIHGLPTTYVLDADGNIIAGNPRMTPQMVEDLVKVLLKN